MKFASKQIATAAVLAALSLGAFAQTPPPAAPGAPAAQAQQGKRFDPAKFQERVAKRQAELKQKLQLTAAQEPAWATWTNAMKPTGNLQRPDRDAIAKLSTPDRIDHMRALRNQRIAEMDRRADATKAFYAALTPDQKKTFDAASLRRGGKGGHGHHGPHRG